MMILVQTSVDHLNVRESIRKTWKKDCDLVPFCACVFVTGTDRKESANIALAKEAKEHHDIVQMGVMEAYNNLTLKTMFSIQ